MHCNLVNLCNYVKFYLEIRSRKRFSLNLIVKKDFEIHERNECVFFCTGLQH